jgi:hypothetical protein
LSCSDSAGATVTYALNTNPAHGSVSALDSAAGKVTYTPTAGYSGPDSFTYHATSNNGTAATQTVSLTVKPPVVRPPRLTGVRMTNQRFRVARKNTPISARAAPLGTTFRFTLSAPASVKIVITRSAPGRRRGHRCVAPTPKLVAAHAKRCTRNVTVGTLTRAHEPQGSDGVYFSGRIGRRPLKPRPYRAILSATNSAGHSPPAALKFVVVG